MTLPANPSGTDDSLKELLAEYKPIEVRLALAIFNLDTQKDACEAVGVSPSSYTGDLKHNVEAIIDRLKVDYVVGSMELLKRYMYKAVAVKLKGLDSHSESIRQKTATELMDRVMGKPKAGDSNSNQNTFNIVYVKEGIDPDVWDDEAIEGELGTKGS
jgi:hypothetical protein